MCRIVSLNGGSKSNKNPLSNIFDHGNPPGQGVNSHNCIGQGSLNGRDLTLSPGFADAPSAKIFELYRWRGIQGMRLRIDAPGGRT